MKKIIAGIAALTLSLSAFSNIALAEEGDWSLASANDGKLDDYGSINIALSIDGVSNGSKFGQIWLRVPTGTVDLSSDGVGMVDDKALSDGAARNPTIATWTVGATKDGDSDPTGYEVPDGYDTITMNYFAGKFVKNADDYAATIYITPLDTSKDLEVIISNSTFGNASGTSIDKIPMKSYIVKAGTSEVSEKSDATPEPTAEPTVAPTAEPTVAPTAEPTVAPTAEPTVAPTAEPTVEPTAAPIAPVEYTGDVDEGDSSKVTDKTLAWTFDVPVLEGQHSIIFKIWNSADPSHKWQKVVTDEVALDGVVGNAKVGLLFTFNPEDPDYIAKFGNVKMDSGIAIAE